MSVTAKITVRELVPELVDDYISFFDGVYRNDPWLNTKTNPWWGICYCGFYDDPRTEEERNKVPNAQMENRKQRGKYIQSGKAHGLLAYVDDHVVGWINAGPRSEYVNLRGLVNDIGEDDSVGSVLCFVVAEPHRGKGIATALLAATCVKFQLDGLKIAEAYPRTKPAQGPYNTPWNHANYRGSLEMFSKAGFVIHKQLERHAIFRKQL